MRFKDEEGWLKSVEANTDPYGAAIIRYAERWANLMEDRMASLLEGRITPENSQEALLADPSPLVSEVAKQTSHDADTEGITGFMYGCAVSILSQVWYYGEALRRWHNLATQLRNEGERANESGGVLNPALLSIG